MHTYKAYKMVGSYTSSDTLSFSSSSPHYLLYIMVLLFFSQKTPPASYHLSSTIHPRLTIRSFSFSTNGSILVFQKYKLA